MFEGNVDSYRPRCLPIKSAYPVEQSRNQYYFITTSFQ